MKPFKVKVNGKWVSWLGINRINTTINEDEAIIFRETSRLYISQQVNKLNPGSTVVFFPVKKETEMKRINLQKLFLIIAICFASVIAYLCAEVFFNIAITVFNETRLTIAEVCLYGVVACMALFFITKKW